MGGRGAVRGRLRLPGLTNIFEEQRNMSSSLSKYFFENLKEISSSFDRKKKKYFQFVNIFERKKKGVPFFKKYRKYEF